MFAFDKIRLLKILEIFQFSIVFYVLSFISAKIIQKILSAALPTRTSDELRKTSKIRIFFEILYILIINSIFYFYIMKVGKLVPPISYIFPSTKFEDYTTLVYIENFIVIFVLMFGDKNVDDYLQYLIYE